MKGSLHRHFKFEVMGVCCEKDEPVEVAAIVVRRSTIQGTSNSIDLNSVAVNYNSSPAAVSISPKTFAFGDEMARSQNNTSTITRPIYLSHHLCLCHSEEAESFGNFTPSNQNLNTMEHWLNDTPLRYSPILVADVVESAEEDAEFPMDPESAP